MIICPVSGPKPSVSNHAFEDLLGSQGFSSTAKANEQKTIASMRRQQLVEDMDPDKLKVDKKQTHQHRLVKYLNNNKKNHCCL